MTEAGATSRRRVWWKYLLLAVLTGVLALVCLAWYATTNSFQAMVRRRMIAELGAVTGGRVELGSYHTSPFRLRVEVRDLTIHGREKAGEVPYAHVDRVVATVKIISVLGAEFGFHSIVLDHPIIHIIVYPDGSTNQPAPKIKQASGKTPLEQLFRLSISRLEVRHGEILWNDQSLPMDFVADDVSADMTYSLLHQRYETNLLLGKIVTRVQNYRPVAWMLEAHLVLGSNAIEVRSLKANSGRSHLQASGHLEGFRAPQIQAVYNVQLDLTEVSAILRRPEMRRGNLQAQGRGSWTAQQFSSSGKFLLKDFDWQDNSLKLNNVALDAKYAATSQRISISQIQARLLGGSATGDGEISGWLGSSPSAKSAKGKAAEEQRGNVSLHLKDLSVGGVAAALSSSQLPLQRMNLAGTGGGTVEIQWKDSPRNSEVKLALDAAPQSSTPSNQVPLIASLRAAYQLPVGDLEVANFTAATRFSKIRASGRLSNTGALQLSVSTSNLGEWQQVLGAFGNHSRIPILLRGQASFDGAAAGRIPNLSFAGNLQVQDFDYTIPATSRTPEQPFHWDVLSTDVQFSNHVFAARNATLRHGATVINFDVNAGLDHGQFTDDSPFQAQVDMDNANLAELLALAGYDYPARGNMNLSFRAGGSRAQPNGTGHLEFTDANFYGQNVEHVDSDLRFQSGGIQFTNIRLAYGAARVAGAAGFNLSSRAFHFDLNGSNFDLARFPQLQTNRLTVEGRMDFTSHGAGTPQEPNVNATVHLSGLTLDHERAGDFTLDGVTHGAQLTLTGRSQFQPAELAIDGKVELRGDLPATLNVHFNHLDVDALLRNYLRGPVTGHSAAAGEALVQGPLRRPRELSLSVTLNELSAEVEYVPLHNHGLVHFTISDRLFRIDPFRLVGDNTDLSAGGDIQLTGEQVLHLHAQGSANLKLIETFDPGVTSSGSVAVDMTASGIISRPVLQGRVQVTNGGIAYTDLPSALSDINGALIFNQNRLQVENLTAHMGGGLVAFGGYAILYDRKLNFDLTLTEHEVRLRYPPGISSTANADLHFAGTSEASTLSGDITVIKLSVTPGFDFGAYLARSARTALPQTNPVLNRIRLDVHLVTTPELQMQTAEVRLSGDADLRLRGTAAKPVLLGRAEVLEGQVYFNGTKYELERGDISFTSPVTTTPILDLQASTHVRDYDITLTLNGELDKLKVSYRSEPPLAEADIIALLALGHTTEESAQLQQTGQSPFTQEASSAIINQALNATVSNRMQRLFGVSRIKVDPEGLSTETNPGRGAAVTIEQQVADNLTITFSTSVAQASQQIIQVEYNLTHNVSIVALRDQNGVVSFDIKIRQRKK